jgi:hypothetical protein
VQPSPAQHTHAPMGPTTSPKNDDRCAAMAASTAGTCSPKTLLHVTPSATGCGTLLAVGTHLRRSRPCSCSCLACLSRRARLPSSKHSVQNHLEWCGRESRVTSLCTSYLPPGSACPATCAAVPPARFAAPAPFGACHHSGVIPSPMISMGPRVHVRHTHTSRRSASARSRAACSVVSCCSS